MLKDFAERVDDSDLCPAYRTDLLGMIPELLGVVLPIVNGKDNIVRIKLKDELFELCIPFHDFKLFLQGSGEISMNFRVCKYDGNWSGYSFHMNDVAPTETLECYEYQECPVILYDIDKRPLAEQYIYCRERDMDILFEGGEHA